MGCRAIPCHTQIRTILLSPKLRVPEIIFASALGKGSFIHHRIPHIFFVVHPIPDSKALCLYLFRTAIRLHFLGDSRIHKQMPSVRKHHGAARKTPIPVILHIRRQGCRQMLPMQQVPAHSMPPVHGAPEGAIRVILIEHMVFPLIKGKSIRVIHPPHTGG